MRSRQGVVAATTVRTPSSRSATPHSWAVIITLRTKGERGDQWSFIERPPSAEIGCAKHADVLRDRQFGLCAGAKFVRRQTFDDLAYDEARRLHVDHGDVGVDPLDTFQRRHGQTAGVEQARFAL